MAMADPISDFLTQIRNANMVFKEKVELPSSRLKEAIASILKREGYIRNYRVIEHKKKPVLRVYLKYGPNRERVITNMKRISRPSLRVYAGVSQLPRVLGGLGIAIVSTPRGLLTDSEARRQNVGGEVLCEVW
ncbi:MAG TPA: 30S ribosomal protein S8 [Synergistaceae bacterium]|nr:30S ribosomal protein S8 [Synergistaceae bacterium]